MQKEIQLNNKTPTQSDLQWKKDDFLSVVASRQEAKAIEKLKNLEEKQQIEESKAAEANKVRQHLLMPDF